MLQVKTKNVRWNEGELAQLAEDVALLRLADPVPSIVTLVNQAQQKLPENRRRIVTTVSRLTGFVERVRSVIEIITTRPPPPQVVTAPPKLGELAATMFTRLEQLLSRLEAPVASRPSPIPFPAQSSPTVPPVLPKTRKLVIAVVGLLPGQAQDLVSRTKSLPVELRCIPQDIARTEFPSGAQEVLLFAKFIKHQWQTAAYANFPRENVHVHHGGVQQAAEIIKRVVNEKVKKGGA